MHVDEVDLDLEAAELEAGTVNQENNGDCNGDGTPEPEELPPSMRPSEANQLFLNVENIKNLKCLK